MDPNATYEELKGLMIPAIEGYVLEESEISRMGELFFALDNWLQQGGFLPTDWERTTVAQNKPEDAAGVNHMSAPTRSRFTRFPFLIFNDSE